jgi:hypothetical protein
MFSRDGTEKFPPTNVRSEPNVQQMPPNTKRHQFLPATGGDDMSGEIVFERKVITTHTYQTADKQYGVTVEITIMQHAYGNAKVTVVVPAGTYTALVKMRDLMVVQTILMHALATTEFTSIPMEARLLVQVAASLPSLVVDEDD